jgi:rhodanese-related sulfurtransferase
MSAERCSTIGRERLSNPALQPISREQFTELLTAGLAAPPKYFARDVELNRAGAEGIEDLPAIPPLSPPDLEAEVRRGAWVVDTRPAADYCAGHVPGSIALGLNGPFAPSAGAVLGLDVDVVLVAESPETAAEARMRLARVGLERARGYLAGGAAAWASSGRDLRATPVVTAPELGRLLQEQPGLPVLDVRRPWEFEKGHLPGASNLPLDQLPLRARDLDPARTVAIHCQSGYRSATAAGFLERHGIPHRNMPGGFAAWVAAGLAAETGPATAP